MVPYFTHNAMLYYWCWSVDRPWMWLWCGYFLFLGTSSQWQRPTTQTSSTSPHFEGGNPLHSLVSPPHPPPPPFIPKHHPLYIYSVTLQLGHISGMLLLLNISLNACVCMYNFRRYCRCFFFRVFCLFNGLLFNVSYHFLSLIKFTPFIVLWIWNPPFLQTIIN